MSALAASADAPEISWNRLLGHVDAGECYLTVRVRPVFKEIKKRAVIYAMPEVQYVVEGMLTYRAPHCETAWRDVLVTPDLAEAQAALVAEIRHYAPAATISEPPAILETVAAEYAA